MKRSARQTRVIVVTFAWLACTLAPAHGVPANAVSGDRLAQIRERGALNCGVWPHMPGFAIEQNGQYSGFDVDFCRAVAAALFGDPDRVAFTALADARQFARHAEVDLVVRRLTWTLPREAAGDFTFGPVTFYDGQALLVARDSGIRSATELAGSRICVIGEEGHPATLRDYYREGGREVQLVLVGSDEEAEGALVAGRCRAYSADASWLAAARSRFAGGLSRYDILPERLSKEPLAPLIRARDRGLIQLVRWTVYAMIEAEEVGLDTRNVDAIGPAASRAQRLLAIRPGIPEVTVSGGWVHAIIAGVGNYGEVFERNLGAGSSMGLDRGLNRLWNRGGLMYAPPLDR